MTTASNELKKAAAGDLQSVEQICLANWEPLYRFIYFKVQNREEAEDITQETFVRALTYWREHNHSGDNSLGFMKTVAQNIIRDRWRQKQRRGAPVNYDEAYLEAGIDDQILVTQRLQVEAALKKLNNEQQTVLDARIIKGYSVAATAKLLGKSEGAVRTLQYRALKVLAQLLEERD